MKKSPLLLGATFLLFSCGNAREALKLQGNYQTQAEQELSIRVGGVGCVVHELDIKGFDMTIRQTAYADRKCGGDALGVVMTSGTYSIGEKLDIEPGARAMDLKISKVTVTPLNSSWGTVFGLDATGECEVKDLAVNETRDVTGKNCAALGSFPAKDAVYFTSFNLKDDVFRFTRLPSEELDHVGTEAKPAKRNLRLEVEYRRN
ncbi:MAG: hypothetical protein ABIR96_12085 [Bdellovibrionota bacterium]